jgi:hypothetical protein
MESQKFYQFYAELEEFKPKIWRRFQISGNVTIAEFAYIVMTMFEMRASHLFCIEHNAPTFTPTGRKSKRTKFIDRYVIPHGDGFDEPGDLSATSTKLSQINFEENSFLNLWYDFGDDWFVRLTPEEITEQLPEKDLPKILDGKCFGIVEDCGGIWGLEDLIEVFKQKSGDDYEDLCEWLGTKDFDIKNFDLEEMNSRIKSVPKIYKKIYEKKAYPTKKEIDLIERNSGK